MKLERKVNLDIIYCVNCRKNALHNAFPHYCDECIAYLKKHGKMPEPDISTEQTEFKRSICDNEEEIPEENR